MLVLPLVSKQLSVVRTSPAYAITLIVGIVLWTLSINMDFLFIAERKVKYGLVRNASFSLLKLPLVVVPVLLWSPTSLALFATWVVSSALALMIAVQIARRRLPHRWSAALAGVRDEVKAMVQLACWPSLHQSGRQPADVPSPAHCHRAARRRAERVGLHRLDGWELRARHITDGLGFALCGGVTRPRCICAASPEELQNHRRLFIPLIIVVVVLGHPILGVFGAQYAKHSYGLLVILAAVGDPRRDHERLRGDDAGPWQADYGSVPECRHGTASRCPGLVSRSPPGRGGHRVGVADRAERWQCVRDRAARGDRTRGKQEVDALAGVYGLGAQTPSIPVVRGRRTNLLGVGAQPPSSSCVSQVTSAAYADVSRMNTCL